ncbi:MAG: hypothetical protein ACOH5I_21095 [Oligoflexus sp.]
MAQVKRRFYFVWTLSFFLLACQQEKEMAQTTQTSTKETQEETCLQANECQDEVSQTTPLSCQDLGIPSWNFRVERLALHYCESCHNDQFAWDDIKLNSYQEFVKNADASIARIRSRNLSFTLPTSDANQFIAWYESGMPLNESDCNSASDSE